MGSAIRSNSPSSSIAMPEAAMRRSPNPLRAKSQGQSIEKGGRRSLLCLSDGRSSRWKESFSSGRLLPKNEEPARTGKSQYRTRPQTVPYLLPYGQIRNRLRGPRTPLLRTEVSTKSPQQSQKESATPGIRTYSKPRNQAGSFLGGFNAGDWLRIRERFAVNRRKKPRFPDYPCHRLFLDNQFWMDILKKGGGA